jgi:hypothetical protein
MSPASLKEVAMSAFGSKADMMRTRPVADIIQQLNRAYN